MFFDFLLSKQGQELIQNLNYKYSVREDVSPLPGIPELKSLNTLLPHDPEDYAAKKDIYVQEFNQFLQKGAH